MVDQEPTGIVELDLTDPHFIKVEILNHCSKCPLSEAGDPNKFCHAWIIAQLAKDVIGNIPQFDNLNKQNQAARTAIRRDLKEFIISDNTANAKCKGPFSTKPA
jgi:hypothetical protein